MKRRGQIFRPDAAAEMHKKEDNPEGITLLLPTSQKLYPKGEKKTKQKSANRENTQGKFDLFCPVVS